MEPQLEPIMAIDVPQTISGERIVDDLLSRVADRLGRDCNLRGSDCYAGYSARVRVDLWLQDVDTTEVNADLAIGQAESAPPSQTITMGVGAAADQVAGPLPASLERFIDGGALPEDAVPKEKRTYVSRIRARKE